MTMSITRSYTHRAWKRSRPPACCALRVRRRACSRAPQAGKCTYGTVGPSCDCQAGARAPHGASRRCGPRSSPGSDPSRAASSRRVRRRTPNGTTGVRSRTWTPRTSSAGSVARSLAADLPSLNTQGVAALFRLPHRVDLRAGGRASDVRHAQNLMIHSLRLSASENGLSPFGKQRRMDSGARIDDVNFAMHPLTNPYDWYEREFLRMAYKMQKISAEEAGFGASRASTSQTTGGASRRNRKRRPAPSSENATQ